MHQMVYNWPEFFISLQLSVRTPGLTQGTSAAPFLQQSQKPELWPSLGQQLAPPVNSQMSQPTEFSSFIFLCFIKRGPKLSPFCLILDWAGKDDGLGGDTDRQDRHFQPSSFSFCHPWLHTGIRPDLITHRPTSFHWKETCTDQALSAPVSKAQRLGSVTRGLDQHLSQGPSSTHSYSMLSCYVAFYLPVSRINSSKNNFKSTICILARKQKVVCIKCQDTKGKNVGSLQENFVSLTSGFIMAESSDCNDNS